MNRWGFNRCNFSSVFNPGDYTVREGICALERDDLGRWVEWKQEGGCMREMDKKQGSD